MAATPRFVQKDNARRINRSLLEGLFFHRQDNPNLYADLYEQREEFKRVWEETFGIELIVKEHVAYRRHQNTDRDPRSGFTNNEVPNDARMHFMWSGANARLRILAFQRFLYWYETDLRRRPQMPHGEFEFHTHELWAWLAPELTNFLNRVNSKSAPHLLFDAQRAVIKELERFGFVRRLKKHEVSEADRKALRSSGYTEDTITSYAARPGLTCYDPYTLNADPTAFERAFVTDANLDGDNGEEVE